MNATFHLSPKVKHQGIGCALLFLVAVVGYSSLLFLAEPEQHGFKGRPSVLVVSGMGIVVFGSMLLLSLYMWASYHATLFSINDTKITIQKLFQNHELGVNDLKLLKWRVYPSRGSVLFRTSSSKSSIALDGFSRADRLKIIRILRAFVSDQLQEGWPLFCHKVALPLRDGKPSILRSEPNAKLYTITRTRYDRILFIALPLSIALALLLWLQLDLPQSFVLPAFVLLLWLYIRSNIPSEGYVTTRLLSTSHGWFSLISWGAIVASQLLMISLILFDVSKETACWASVIVLLVAFPPMLYFMCRSEKEQKGYQAIELALIEWENGEMTH